MAKYTYQTATVPVAIDVDEKWAAILMDADNDMENNDRSQTRPDHKYAPGAPVSIDSLQYAGDSLADKSDGIGDAECRADFENAFGSLTVLQRRYFVLARMKGYSYTEIARREGKKKETVFGIVTAAAKNIKKFLAVP